MEAIRQLWYRLARPLGRRHSTVKSFDQALRAAGPLLGQADAGLSTVPLAEIVGSVNRWQSLRADFSNRTGAALTERHRRLIRAIRDYQPLPPVELYRLTIQSPNDRARQPVSEYYVLDGHHRVAIAHRLGQDFLDAHVIEYRVAAPAPESTMAPSDGALHQRRARRRRHR